MGMTWKIVSLRRFVSSPGTGRRGHLAAVLATAVLLSGLGLGCKEKENAAATPSAKLPPLDIVDGEPGSPKVVRIDQEALEKVCTEANVPVPPGLATLQSGQAQMVHDTIEILLNDPTTAAYGRLGHVYRIVAVDTDDLLRAVECYETAKSLAPEAFEWPYRMAKIFWSRRSTERADIEFGEAEKLNPNYAMIHWWRGRIDLDDKRPDKARAHFERFIKLKPDDSAGYVGMGHAHLLAEDYEAAFKSLTRAVELQPDNRIAHELLAQVYFYLGQVESANKERGIAASLPGGGSLLEHDPVEIAAWMALPLDVISARISSLESSANLADASALCTAALREHPNDDLLLTKQAWLYLRQGNVDKAIATATQSLKINADNYGASVILVDCLLAEDKPDEALATIERVIGSDEKLADAHRVRGKILFLKERYGDAEAAFRRATELEPDNQAFLLMLADILIAQKKTSDAKECWQRTLELDPGDPPSSPQSLLAHLSLARIFAAEGLLQEAADNFREVLRIDPVNSTALVELGRMFAQQGKANEAMPYIRKAVQLQPNNAGLRVTLGQFLITVGQDAEAAKHLLAAVRLAPTHGFAYYVLGGLQAKSGDTTAARENLEKAVQYAPALPQAYLGLSSLAQQEKDHDSAQRYLREGLKHAPEAPELLNGLAWTLATHHDASRRNGEEAIGLAEKACKITQHAHPGLLDTLAAAYAEGGRFEEAIKTEQDAIKLATDTGQDPSIERFKARLALYEAGKPYRDEGD